MAIQPAYDKETYVTLRVASEASGYPRTILRRAIQRHILEGKAIPYRLNSGRDGVGFVVSREALRHLVLSEIDLSPVATIPRRVRAAPPTTLKDACRRVAELEESVDQLSQQMAEMFGRMNYKEKEAPDELPTP